MSLRVLSVNHHRHGLAAVEHTSGRADLIADALRETPGVGAVLTLSTCNRVEFLVDAPDRTSESLSQALQAAGVSDPGWEAFDADAALTHLFRVTAGLESLVVGEREIAGQVRRMLAEAQDDGTISPTLSLMTEEALRCARRVGRETTLAETGRSIVSVALDLANPEHWASTRVLLVGTGSFAGASMAALRARGASQIQVHSVSGRADEFAHRHDLTVAQDLAAALTEVDVVVACRGSGSPALTLADVRPDARLMVLDLSLSGDVAPEVARLPGIELINLETLKASLPPTWHPDTLRADEIVRQGTAELRARLHARQLDPAIVTLRQSVHELVQDEVDRLPKGRALDVDDAARALRRLATRLLHVPSSRARIAAATGRTDQYLSAMSELYGIGGPDAGLEDAACPATGLRVEDLGPDADRAVS